MVGSVSGTIGALSSGEGVLSVTPSEGVSDVPVQVDGISSEGGGVSSEGRVAGTGSSDELADV